MPQVLLLSNIHDFSTDLVAAALSKLGTTFLRLNREQLPTLRVTLDPATAAINVRTPSGRTTKINGAEAKAVWFRQPVFLRNTPAKPLSINEQLERSQWSAFLRGLTVLDNPKWMNHPARTYLAECKPYQLRLAAKLGFAVPATRIGNDIEGIRSASLGNPVIVKSIDTVLLHEKDDCLFTYSTAVDMMSWNDEQLAAAPVLCQEFISEKVDIRVTVVGKEIFAVRITDDNAPVVGDWRVRPKDTLRFAPFELDSQCSKRCLQMVDELGLSFAALDLLELPDNRGYVFLEINPTGEWGWLVQSGLRIDLAIADWLATS